MEEVGANTTVLGAVLYMETHAPEFENASIGYVLQSSTNGCRMQWCLYKPRIGPHPRNGFSVQKGWSFTPSFSIKSQSSVMFTSPPKC